MPVTIDDEAKQRIIRPIEIDNYGERFQTSNGLFVFTDPWLWIIQKNMYYLLKDATEKTFDPKYNMRPDYMSYDEYGTTSLAYVLMYVNDVFSVEDFYLDVIVIPSFSSIVRICRQKFSEKDVNNLNQITW